MPRSLKESHDALVVQAVGLLRAWIGRDHRLYEVAGALEVSYGFLEGLFKASLGVDLHTYRTFIRLERARSLLACLALPIGEVARLSGFRRHAYFAKVFRGSCSMTPTEYRTRLAWQADPGRCPAWAGRGCALARLAPAERRRLLATMPPCEAPPAEGFPAAASAPDAHALG